MSRRVRAALVAVLAAITGLVVGTATPVPVGAAPTDLELTMVPETGVLQVRDADEPYLLESPTTIVGTYDDGPGTVTGADLSTPPFSFEAPVLGGALTAEVDATFTQIGEGTTSGQLSPDGTFTLQSTLRVDLHIEIPDANVTADCTLTPVQLSMVSVEPYSPETGRVTISDPDFTIPPAQVTAQCTDLVAKPLNELLAGSGHSLTMTVDGDMALPTGGTEASTTALAVSPQSGAAVGEEVTLSATVASAEASVVEVPTGTVTFLDGDRSLGQVAVVGGVATLTTTRLRLGQHTFTARYNGDPTYLQSTSAPVAYTISATPTVNADLPTNITIGDPPAELAVLTENPSVGTAITNARVDITISRYSSNGTSFDALDPDDLVLELESAPGTWIPVPLSPVAGTTTPTLTGSLGAVTGRPLAPGESFEDRIRLAFPSGDPQTIPGPLDVELAVVAVDPGTGEVTGELAATTGRVNLFLPGRVQSSIDFVAVDADDYGPQTIRQGGTMAFSGVSVVPALGGTRPTGTVSVAIDGQVVPSFGNTMLLTDPPAEDVPLSPDCGCLSPLFVDLPAGVGVGPHTMTIVYDGDSQFTPSSRSVAFTVVPPASRPYRCAMDVFTSPRRFNVQVETYGRLPAAAKPTSELALSDFSFRILADRNQAEYLSFSLLVSELATFEGLTLDLGPGGSGGATTGSLSPAAFEYGPEVADDPDVVVDFGDESATIPLTGAPGTEVTPTLEGFTLRSDVFGAPQEMTCEAVGDPIGYGSTTIAGTTLEVTAPTPVRADDEITLTASVFPESATGTVQFRDGGALLDIAAVEDGRAVSTVTLPAGAHDLTARFLAGATAPSTTSEVVPLQVLPVTDCAEFAQPGNAAAVRLVYLELLRRCPDQPGFDHWTRVLDEGVTREQFARQISLSLEARKVIVDDAYMLMLERPAEPAARDFWARRLGTGRYDSLLADLAASPEFWTLAGGTDEGFVERVYQRILQRDAEPDGIAYWADRLDRGMSRRRLVLTLVNLTEPLSTIVGAAYEDILGRAPAAGELRDGVALLRSTGSRSRLYASLIGTPAFFTRAQSYPNPED